MEMNDLRLKNGLNSMFNVKGSDINEPNVVAAVITAASKMARCTEIITEDMTVEQLLDLYQKVGDAQVMSLVGMGPQYVKNNIGYAVDFNDIASAQVAYQANKKSYDELYSKISERSMIKSESKQM